MMTSIALSALIVLNLSALQGNSVLAEKEQNNAQVIRLSEPVMQDDKSETFGAKMSTNLAKVKLKALGTAPKEHLDSTFQVDTKIAKVCQKKGCFFIAQDGDTVIRVSFKDYAFFIPTDTAGKMVTLEGALIEKQLSEEQAAHYRSDLRSNTDLSESIQAGKVYEIVASSVKIPKA